MSPKPRTGDWETQNALIFLPDEVTRVDIAIDPADFNDLLANPQSNDLKMVTVRWRNSQIDETLDFVGFRVRGNTSRSADRKSWKVDFKAFTPGQNLHGLEEANLNGSSNDPTVVRTALCWKALRDFGLPGARTHFVALYVNGTFWSIQTHVEHYDEEFTNNWFGGKDGNLYKCLYQGSQADLSFRFDEDYASVGGGSTYDELNNDPLSDYSDLAAFIRLITQEPGAVVLEELEYHLNVDSFLRYLAMNVALGSWDDYWYGSNNFYLYHSEATDRFEWIPYDYDNTIGTDFFGVNWSDRHFENWGRFGFGTDQPPLTEAVFAHSPWRRQWRRYLADAADLLQDPALRAQVAAWVAMLTPYYDGTIESGGAVGNSPNFYPEGLTVPSTWGGFGERGPHKMGLEPFMDERANSLRTQLSGFTTPALPNVRINEIQASNNSTISDEMGEFEDWIELVNLDASPVDLSGWYLTDDVTSPTKWMIPAGVTIPANGYLLFWADDDEAQGPLHTSYNLSLDGEHLGLFTSMAEGRVLVDDFDAFGLSMISDSTAIRFPNGSDTITTTTLPTPSAENQFQQGGGGEPTDPPKLFVNEFMASNATTISDEFGEFDDWIEIYNADTVAVSLDGLHLSDDSANPTQWAFPSGLSIPAGSFLLVWTDGDDSQGDLHTNFRLSAGGEEIGIYDTEANNFQEVHRLVFGAQTDDVTQGLLPDGEGALQTLESPTPGTSNMPGPTSIFGGWTMY
ncbi:MAG: CotH kinase family protein [Sumerlaeia bacterium]